MEPNERDAAWFRAMTLQERIASLNGDRALPSDGIKLADAREQRWRTHAGVSSDSDFSRRLAQDRIPHSDFRQVLGEPIESLRARVGASPDWLEELMGAYADCPENYLFRNDLPDGLRTLPGIEFLEVVGPLLWEGRNRLQEGTEALAGQGLELPLEPNSGPGLFVPGLALRLYRWVVRTLVLELNAARLQERLQGTTEQERLSHFFAQLRDRKSALEVLREYPALARGSVEAMHQWSSFSLDFLRHLSLDWPLLRSTFSPQDDPGPLAKLSGGSDSHNGGRSVQALQFRSGLRLMYKPRSLGVDGHFQALLEWLNERGQEPRFRTVRCLDRGDHGWMEYVPFRECASQDEVTRFYEAQGGTVALLYALGAADFHYENLIAEGPHPVLIDLETLFHPARETPNSLPPAYREADRDVAASVLTMGLLPSGPFRLFGPFEVDVSGIGARSGQISPDEWLHLESFASDQMRFVRKRTALPDGLNRPRLGGTEVDAAEYAGAVLRGFARTYELLVENREALVAPGGPIEAFANDEIRVVKRPTRIYSKLIQESVHPEVLSDSLKRERGLDKLWAASSENPSLECLIPAERESLLSGDIPMFRTRVGSRDLWNGSGTRHFPSYFQSSGLERARTRLLRMGESDLQNHEWLIRASMATLPGAKKSSPAAVVVRREDRSVRNEAILGLAQGIGDLLLRRSVTTGDGEAAWIGLNVSGLDGSWYVGPVPLDLFNGLSGIALFLGHLGIVTMEERYTLAARGTCRTILQSLPEALPVPEPLIGTLFGWGGVCHVLSQLGTLWNDERVLDGARKIAIRLPEWIESDKHQEEPRKLFDGTAGEGLALLRIPRAVDDPVLRRKLEEALSSLLSHPILKDFSLAHGELGITEFLSAAGEGLGNPHLQESIEARVDQVLDIALRQEFVCGTPDGVETPGFGAGLAGIGYGLLRLARPEEVPFAWVQEPRR